MRDSQGPVLTRTPDGELHVSYIVLTGDEEGQITGAEVSYQETFDDPIAAGAEFQEIADHCPKLDTEKAFGSVEELLEFKNDIQRQNVRMRVEHAELDREIFGDEIDRPS